MKDTARKPAGPALKRPVSAILAAMLLSLSASGCAIGEIAGQFRDEYAPPAQSGETGMVEGPPPPIVRPGDRKDDETEAGDPENLPGAETEAPDVGPADPAPSEPDVPNLPGSRPLTLKNAAAANEMSLLVARYGCVLTEEETANGLRKGYHYLIDTPGGRASVEFCDMRGTPLGCFGTVLTADGVTLYAEAQDFDNPVQSVTLTESASPFTAFDNPFAPYLDGSMQIGEQTGEISDADIRRIHCESKDGTRRADFTLDADSYEIRSFTEYYIEGSERTVTYASGADRFGADRVTAALTDYYSLSPEDLTFTIEDVRNANRLSSLLPAFGSAGYTLETEENGKKITECAVAYESGGRRIVVFTDTAGGVTERRYLRDGVNYPDADGYAFRSAESSADTDDLISAFLPDGTIGSVTVSGTSVLFTVRTVKDGTPVLVKIIVEKDSLLLRSCEMDTIGENSHALSALTVTRGGEKTDEALFLSLGGERTLTYHVSWTNAPAEDLTYFVPASWAFRLSFLSDASYWYDEAHTDPAPQSYQAVADGNDREIWVTGAVKYAASSDGTGLPGSAPSGIGEAALVSANHISNLVARYGSVTETADGKTTAYRKDGALWVRYEKNADGETAKVGAVRVGAEDGWTSYTAAYGDVVKNPDADYEYDEDFSSLLTAALRTGTLRELIPAGGIADGDRVFLIRQDARRFIRFTADRDSLALRSWQTVKDGAVTEEIRFWSGVFAGDDFLRPWDRTRVAAFHVLGAGDEIAFIRIRIPQGASLRLEMPEGWNWFFLDEALTEPAPSWIQVTAGDGDAELWVDNRDPANRTDEPSNPPAPEPPAEDEAGD